MIIRQRNEYENYFYRYTENNRTGYLENYLSDLNVDTAVLRRKVKARIRRLNQCLKAIDAAEAKELAQKNISRKYKKMCTLVKNKGGIK